ncbi:MAG: hypothetical protein ACO3B3_00190 [Cyanobium sp.]
MVALHRMLPWRLAAVTLAAVVVTAPLLVRHLVDGFDERPEPAWDRRLNPIEAALLRWIGDAGRSAESAAGSLVPLLISNALIALPALALLLVHQCGAATLLIRNQERDVQRACAGCRDGCAAWLMEGFCHAWCLRRWRDGEPQESPRSRATENQPAIGRAPQAWSLLVLERRNKLFRGRRWDIKGW